MKAPWPIVPLGQAIRHRKEFITIDDLTEYKRCRVQLHAKGIVLRDIVTGASIGTKKQQVCRAGEFLVAEIDAKVGGFGIVPGDLDGAIVSSHYFLYEINEQQLERRFLDYYIRTRSFRDQVEAQGSTNYAAIRPWYVLDYTIPLPPLAEQQRIVARIDALAARIEEAKGLRAQAMAEVEAVMGGKLDEIYDDLATRYGLAPLDGACASITDGDHVTPRFSDGGTRFIFVGNVSSGYLHFNGCKYVDPAYYESLKEYRKPKRGDILYSAVGATLGVPAIVDADEAFCFQRHIAILKPDRKIIDSTFMWYLLRSRRIHSHAWGQTTGSAQPTVPLRAIRAFPIVIPPISEQHQIAESLNDLQSKVDAVRRLQAETQAELDALLPAVLDRAFRGEL